MSDVRCPRCGDSFRIPDAGIPAGARARCPWCDETLPVSELLSSLPPMAVLIGEGDQPIAATEMSETLASNPWEQHGAQGDQSATQIDSAGSADNESLSAAESDWRSDASDDQRIDRDEALDELLEIDDSDQLAGDTEPVEPRPLQEVSDMAFGREARAVATKPRQRKKSSPLRSILGIVIGGLMALPLAAVILAFFGKPLDIGFWPFDGKTIATGSSARTAAPPVMPPASGSRSAPPQGRSLAEDLPDNGGADAAPAEDAFPPTLLEPSDPQTPMIFPPADEPVTSDDADLLAGDDAANRFDRDAADVPGDSVVQPSPDPTAQRIVPPSSGPELIDPPPSDPTPSDPTASDEDAPEPESRTIDSPEPLQSAPASVDETTAEDSALTLPDLDLSADGPNMSVAAARIDRQAAPAPDAETAADSDEGQRVTPEAPETTAPPEVAAPEISAATPEASTPDASSVAASDVETLEVAEAATEPMADEQAPAGDTSADMTPASQRRLSTPQLEAAFVAAEEAVQAVESYDDAEGTAGLKGRLATLYSSIAAAGEIAAPADESELTALIDRLTANNLVKDLAPAAANWLKYSKRPNDGMLAVGALRQENEKWFLDWSGAAPLEIRWTDQAAAQEHAQVLVLGRIVNADQAAPAVEATLVKPIE